MFLKKFYAMVTYCTAENAVQIIKSKFNHFQAKCQHTTGEGRFHKTELVAGTNKNSILLL